MKKTSVSALLLSALGAVAYPSLSAASVGDNVALGKPVSASTIESADLRPEQAVDGDPDTRWSSDFSDHNWLTVDLGDRYTLSGVNIHWENAYSKDYDIKVSNDGNEWTTLASVLDSDGALDELLISGNARYLRVEGYDRATAWGHSIWELEVFGHEVVETPEPAEVTRVSEGKSAVASSTESSSLTADHAVDGDEATRWSSQFRDDNWVYVDLGEVHEIVQVKLLWEVSHASDYEIQTSYDAVDWTTVERVEDGDGGLDDLSISGHGRYVRMQGLQRATKWGYSLWELEVFGYVSDSQGSDDSSGSEGDSDSGDDSGDNGNPDTGGGTDETPDEQAPGVPSGLAVSVLDETSVAVAWQPVNDDTGVMSYQVYRNGNFLTEVMAPTTEIVDSAVVAEVDYTYTVRAGDEAGNWSDSSDSVNITLESGEVIVSGNVQLEWLTPDQRENGDYLELYEIGGYEIRYRLAGEQASETVMVDDPNSTTYSLDLPDGSYEFSIAVYDTNGLYSEFVPIQPLP